MIEFVKARNKLLNKNGYICVSKVLIIVPHMKKLKLIHPFVCCSAADIDS
jgi:hypothetical protein